MMNQQKWDGLAVYRMIFGLPEAVPAVPVETDGDPRLAQVTECVFEAYSGQRGPDMTYHEDRKAIRPDELVERKDDPDAPETETVIANAPQRQITTVRIGGKWYRKTVVKRPKPFAPLEVSERPMWFQKNRDIKPGWHECQQGYAHPEPVKFDMDRMITEEGVRIGQRMFVFHEAVKSDYEPQYWLKPEWLKKSLLQLSESQAIRLAEAWRRLKIGNRAAREIVFGIRSREGSLMRWTKEFSKRKDMRGVPMAAETDVKRVQRKRGNRKNLTAEIVWQKGLSEDKETDLEALVSYYEYLADELPELEPKGKVNLEISNSYRLAAIAEGHGTLIRDRGLSDENDTDYAEFLEEWDEWDDLKERMRGTAAQRLHPMFTESESCRHEFIAQIRTADRKTILLIMKGFFWQRDEETGRYMPPAYSMLTQSQKNQAWEAINARRAELGMIVKEKRIATRL